MYLSPGVATSYLHRRHLTLTRGGIAERHGPLSVIPPAHAASTQPPRSSLGPRAFAQTSPRASPLLPHLYTQQRRVTPTHELTRSFRVPLRINSRLFLLSFLRPPLPPLLAPGVVSPLRSPVTDAYQRRDIQTPVESSRRVRSSRSHRLLH